MLFGFKNTFGEERVSNPNFLSTQSVEVSTVLISWFFLLGTVTESETLISTESTTKKQQSSVSESSSISESESAIQKKASSESESATATNSETVTLTSFPLISETATISESESAIKSQIDSVNESSSLIETESSTQKKFGVTSESETIIESSSSSIIIQDSVLESESIISTQDSDVIIPDSVNESESLISTADGEITFHPTGAIVINADKVPYGLIQTPWKTPYRLAEEDLTEEAYILDGKSNVDKYDLILYRNNWIKLKHLQEGRIYTLILNVFDFSSDSSLPPPTLPLILFFHGQDVIWRGLDADYPTIDTNAKITLYKSRNKVYAELSKPYLPSPGGSDS